MTLTSETRAVLVRAPEVIRERDWVRGTMRDEAGRVCMVGAVQQAGADLSFVVNWREVNHALAAAICALYPTEFPNAESLAHMGLTGWNDYYAGNNGHWTPPVSLASNNEAGKAEVLDVLERAVRDADEH